MTEKKISCNNIDELGEVAAALLELGSRQPVFAFYGELGAGKTTLIKAICNKLGVQDEVSSPTYNIVNEYLAAGSKIFHFDLYRVNDVEELYDLGFDEYLDSGKICLIEWPEIAEKFLEREKVNRVRISRNEGSEERIIHFSDAA